MLEKFLKYMVNLKHKGTFGIKEKIFFFRELSYLIDGGLPILKALDLIKNNSNNFAIKDVCDSIESYLKKGEDLSRSIGRLPNYFNDGDVSILKSGEKSGELTTVLRYLAEEYEMLNGIKNRYISAMLYPGLLFLISISAIYFIFVFIIPGILGIIESFEGLEIPLTTQILISVSEFLSVHNITIIISIILFVFGFSIFLGFDDGKRWFDRFILNIPYIGTFTQYYYLVKFLRYKKLLISAGMEYVEMFRSLKEITGNMHYKDMVDDILQTINKGEMFTSVLHKYEFLIPSDVIVLIKTGEETASIEKAINNSISIYEEEFNKKLENISKVIEPILVVLIGGVVGVIALSIFGIIGNIIDTI